MVLNKNFSSQQKILILEIKSEFRIGHPKIGTISLKSGHLAALNYLTYSITQWLFNIQYYSKAI